MNNYYYQTRNGKRVRVKKGKNRLRIHKGEKVTRATARGSIPTSSGELYGKAALVSGSKSKSIKSQDGVYLRRKGSEVIIKARQGNVKGGAVVGYKRGRKVDAVADYSDLNDTSEFSGYYTRTRRGKKEKVRKRKRRSRPSYLARLTGKNRKMYRSKEYNMALAKEMAKEMEAEKGKPKTLQEKLIGKRYRNAEKRVYNRYKNKYTS